MFMTPAHVREAKQIAVVWPQTGNHKTWDAYCRAELPNLRAHELTIDERRDLVMELRPLGMSNAAIASALGVGKSTIQSDRAFLGEAIEPAKVISVDGRRVAPLTGRQEPAITVSVVPELTPSPFAMSLNLDEIPQPELDFAGYEHDLLEKMFKTDRVVKLISHAGAEGRTAKEIESITGWAQSSASGALSSVASQGRVKYSGRTRDNHGVYVLPNIELAADTIRAILDKYDTVDA